MNTHIVDLPIIEENASIQDTLSILRSKSHVWVVSSKKDMILRGAIGQLDIIRILLPPEARTYRYGSIFSSIKSLYHGMTEHAKDVMTKHVIYCHLEDEISDIIIMMNRHHLRRLPVVTKDHKVIGQITLRRIILSFTKDMNIRSDK